MSTHNISFHGEMRKILSGYPLLSGAMLHALHFPYATSTSNYIHIQYGRKERKQKKKQ